MMLLQLAAAIAIVLLGLVAVILAEKERPRGASAICWIASAIGVFALVFSF